VSTLHFGKFRPTKFGLENNGDWQLMLPQIQAHALCLGHDIDIDMSISGPTYTVGPLMLLAPLWSRPKHFFVALWSLMHLTITLFHRATILAVSVLLSEIVKYGVMVDLQLQVLISKHNQTSSQSRLICVL